MSTKNPSGKSQPGEINGRAKLRDLDVALIRALRHHGVRQTVLCMMFDAAPSHISRVVNGNAWKHV